MKLLRLELRAFGPFSDVVLDLSGGDHGFHVIHGANEAGKSSALRALEQLFFGIPERATDAFKHPYDKLRIGALLRHSDGSILEFLRRKGRTNTLRGPDDKFLVESAELARFLGGVDQGAFSTMFGISRDGLERGGQEILKGGGQLGQVLFAAGSGIADLRAIQDGLRADMEALFKPAGKNQRIPKALHDLRKVQDTIKSLQLSSDEWCRHDRAHSEAQQRRQHLEDQLQGLRARQRRLGRIRDSFPLLARRSEAAAPSRRPPAAPPIKSRELKMSWPAWMPSWPSLNFPNMCWLMRNRSKRFTAAWVSIRKIKAIARAWLSRASNPSTTPRKSCAPSAGRPI
jgi:uncharacterized protein YhaN